MAAWFHKKIVGTDDQTIEGFSILINIPLMSVK